MNTATLIPIRMYVISSGWRADQNRALVFRSGWAAFAQSRQWLPTLAWTRHDGHAGLPQRVHRRPASRSACR